MTQSIKKRDPVTGKMRWVKPTRKRNKLESKAEWSGIRYNPVRDAYHVQTWTNKKRNHAHWPTLAEAVAELKKRTGRVCLGGNGKVPGAGMFWDLSEQMWTVVTYGTEGPVKLGHFETIEAAAETYDSFARS